MSSVLIRLQRWFVPMILGAMLASGVLALAAPVAVPQAGAQSSDFITTEELLPSAFSENVGLGQQDLRVTIARVVRAILAFLGIVAFGFMLYGGFTWMTAGGKPDRVESAQKIIVAAAIGLAIIFASFAITNFVISQLVSATTTE